MAQNIAKCPEILTVKRFYEIVKREARRMFGYGFSPKVFIFSLFLSPYFCMLLYRIMVGPQKAAPIRLQSQRGGI
jgi:hypothetical protein